MAGLFEGKVAFVTGAASGIGAAACRRFAAEGARVVGADIDLPGAQKVAAEIGGTAIALDVRRSDAWQQALAGVVASHGGLDILYLNAGVMTRPASAPLIDDPVPWLTPEGYEKVMSVNVDGVVLGLLAAIAHLTARGGGDVVITASIAGLMEQPPDPFYSMSKHAVVGFARSAGPALAGRNIRVNAVCPGGIDTNIVPSDLKNSGHKFSPPSYIADAVVNIITGGGNGEIWVAYGEGSEPWKYEHPSPRH
jgi:NAD(P)-dependent dehydrogenase (short-subunit alcohol dehydrogenase family)